jgi:hypothetical protein
MVQNRREATGQLTWRGWPIRCAAAARPGGVLLAVFVVVCVAVVVALAATLPVSLLPS